MVPAFWSQVVASNQLGELGCLLSLLPPCHTSPRSTCWGQGIDYSSPSFSHFVDIYLIINETSASMSFGCGFALDADLISCYAVDFIRINSCVTMDSYFKISSSRELRIFGLLRSRPKDKLLRCEPVVGGFQSREILTNNLLSAPISLRTIAQRANWRSRLRIDSCVSLAPRHAYPNRLLPESQRARLQSSSDTTPLQIKKKKQVSFSFWYLVEFQGKIQVSNAFERLPEKGITVEYLFYAALNNETDSNSLCLFSNYRVDGLFVLIFLFQMFMYFFFFFTKKN